MATVTKVGGVALKAFSELPIPSLFEFGSKLYVRIPDSVAMDQSQTIRNAIRVEDFVVTSFQGADLVYPATANIVAEYSTAIT